MKIAVFGDLAQKRPRTFWGCGAGSPQWRGLESFLELDAEHRADVVRIVVVGEAVLVLRADRVAVRIVVAPEKVYIWR